MSKPDKTAAAVFHLYNAPHQPATGFWDSDPVTGKRFRLRLSPHARRRCCGCDRLRQARNLTVQVFYDGLYFWCRKGLRCWR